jgi:ATP-dependent DNA helicase RecG
MVRLIEAVFGAVGERLRRRVELPGLLFEEQLEYPEFAWQEALVNAIAHRDYSLTGAGIEVWLFDNRMEVRSPGPPPPPVTVEALQAGQGAQYSRNPLIARVLTDCGFMREQGEGIPRMIASMEAADLRPPELAVQDFRFALTLWNTPVFDPDTLRWLRRFRHLDLSREQRRNLALAATRGGRFTNREVQKQMKTDLYTASNLIKSLIRKGTVRLPEKRGRIYEVLSPGGPETLPADVAKLLPAFAERDRLPRRALAELWNVTSSRAYLNARALVEAGWLQLEGAGRTAGYRLTTRARNAKVS